MNRLAIGTQQPVAEAIRVALVDDDRLFLEDCQRSMSESSGLICVAAYTEPKAALVEIPDIRPHIVLMDIGMPKMSGIDCTRELSRLAPASRIVMLTGRADRSAFEASFQAGASSYLTKAHDLGDLANSIRFAHTGGLVISADMAANLPHWPQNPKAVKAMPQLSHRESDVLELIRRALPDKTIAGQLGITANTLKGLKRSLFAKLHVHSRSEILVKF